MRKLPTNSKMTILLAQKKEAENALGQIQIEIYAQRKQCDHKYIPLKEYDPANRWFSSSCYCERCGDDGETWWCPKSPDGLCEYQQKDGTYNMHNCIYCHLPDERK